MPANLKWISDSNQYLTPVGTSEVVVFPGADRATL